MKAVNYRYLEFISTFDDHSNGDRHLTEVIRSISDNNRSFRGLNFFDERDLAVLETIGRGKFITFGMHNSDIRSYVEGVSSSVMPGIFKRLRLHGLVERQNHSYKYFGKAVIAAGLSLVLIPALS